MRGARRPVNESEWLAERFEEHRSHLKAVAYRMLGSLAEADDALQESWIRLSRSDTSGVENLGGWLTTVIARVCLAAREPGTPAGAGSPHGLGRGPRPPARGGRGLPGGLARR